MTRREGKKSNKIAFPVGATNKSIRELFGSFPQGLCDWSDDVTFGNDFFGAVKQEPQKILYLLTPCLPSPSLEMSSQRCRFQLPLNGP